MARNKRGRKNRKGYRYLPANDQLVAGTPASNTVVSANWPTTVDEDTYMISTDLTWAKSGGTPGEGPLYVGLAYSDYTQTEIEEALEATASWDKSDKIAAERRKRLVRSVGVFAGVTQDEVLNDGKPIHTKLAFVCESGVTLQTWLWNKINGTLTTGVFVELTGGVHTRRL